MKRWNLLQELIQLKKLNSNLQEKRYEIFEKKGYIKHFPDYTVNNLVPFRVGEVLQH